MARRKKIPIGRTVAALGALSYFVDIRGIPMAAQAADSARALVSGFGSDPVKALALIAGSQYLGVEMTKQGLNPTLGPFRLV